MECFNQSSNDERRKMLTPELRNEISRALVTHMFSYNANPRKELCSKAAKMLVKKYVFLKDVGEHSSGFVSYFMHTAHNYMYRAECNIMHNTTQ